MHDLSVCVAHTCAVRSSYPHIDMWETGVRGAKILRAILREGASPVSALVYTL
eukprot:COSAG03_NODE_173_length_11167_cov_181.916697_2_plen_53_part_00